MIDFTIAGQCYSLKNTRDIFPIPGPGPKCPHCKRAVRIITVPNGKAKDFEKAFRDQIPRAAQQHIEQAVRADIEIFYPSNLQDLDEALVFDLMQKFRVIENDRQVVQKWVQKRIDKENPRVNVKVTPVLWDRTGRQSSLLGDECEAPEIREVV